MGLACVAGAAAVVAGRFDVATFDFCGTRAFALCGEMAATADVVEKGICDTDGLRLDSDLKALLPGLIVAFIAMVCVMWQRLKTVPDTRDRLI